MRPIYRIMFGVSMAVVAASLVALALWGVRLGVDFRGGSVVELHFTQRPAADAVQAELAKLTFDALKESSVNPVGDADLVIKSGPLTESEHQAVLKAVGKAFPDSGLAETRFDSIGPAVGSELTRSSAWAIGLTLVAIAVYIAFVFRAMGRVLSPWVMSVATMLALAHDVLIPLGVFAALTHFMGVEVSAVFVAAILTIMGYSISDTVVVFDRVRENIIKGRLPKGTPFGEVVHASIMQTLVRSINTNITTLLSLVAIYFFGGQSIRYFALALIVGIVCGAYSSIFVASPVLVWMSRKQQR